ncbi:MAG TPA: class I SAM-dependent RNA methyltransferase [Anaerolineales bacterium]|nr:class I SAM-dependent RNA methyltransferase [Anaerolineales bacterium]
MNDFIEVKISGLAYGGDAVGKQTDGRVMFVPFAIPGEVVRVRLVEEKARHAQAELVEMIETSPERVQPRCRHFGTCGGCHYQHMRYPAQLEAKANILREQLARIGGLKDIPEITVVPSPEPWYYRNHLQFHQTHTGQLGFQRAHSNQAFAIKECHLPEAGINRVWPQLDIEPIEGLERINLRQGVEDDLMIILESSSTAGLDFDIEDMAISVVQVDPLGSVVLAGSDYITMEISGRRFRVSATSFFQVNTLQAASMVKLLLEQLHLDPNMTVLDAYSGVGLFSAFLAPKVKRLVGIEVSPQACEDFTINLDEFDHVELFEAPAEEVLGNVMFNPDVIVADPPRAGLGQKAIDGVLAQGAGAIAYISCDPATLARDSKLLAAGGYTLRQITLSDMFPQTFHIESLSIWEK